MSHQRYSNPYYRVNHKVFLMLLIILFVCSLAIGCSQSDSPSTQSDTSSTFETTVSTSEATLEATTEAVVYPKTRITKDDIIYFIMVDRFADSNPDGNLPDVDKNNLRAFQGGDLQGIIDKLDYIKSTGATTIWLTPIMENGPNGYHGYWIYDFYKVDPHFGDLDTLKTLVTTAHSKGIKVILDYVVNHTGYNTPWLNDPEKKDWFHEDITISNWKDKSEVENGWLAGLPDLDQSNPEVASYFIDNAIWWIDETGIDGFRLDTVRHVPHDYWKTFSGAIKSKYPDFFLMGEVWDENPKTLETYHQDGIDSITNYSLFNGIVNGFNSLPNMFSLVNALDKEKAFTHPELNAIFIDNHDNSRFTSLNPRMSMAFTKQALTFIYSYPAIPVLYYGTEIPMSGAFDPENRQFMEWDKVENNEMVSFVQMLAQIRKEYMEDFVKLFHDKSSIAYEISKGDHKLLVIINSLEKEKSINFNFKANSLTDYETGTVLENYDQQTVNITLPPVSIKFLVIK